VQYAQEVDPHAQLHWALLQYFHPQDLHPSGTEKCVPILLHQMDGASQHHQNERCTLLDKLLVTGVALYLCIPGTHGVPENATHVLHTNHPFVVQKQNY
jgi:hypothetical protein